MKTEGRRVAPSAGLILDRAGEGRCEERTLLTDILPDRRFDVAASQPVRGFVVGSLLVSSLVRTQISYARHPGRGGTVSSGHSARRLIGERVLRAGHGPIGTGSSG